MEWRLLGLVWGFQRNGNAFDLLGREGESSRNHMWRYLCRGVLCEDVDGTGMEMEVGEWQANQLCT